MMQRIAVSLLVGVFVCGISATALAGDSELIEPSEGQLDLNERGVDSIAEGEFERAIRLFEASLDLGELNVTHTNLGRAYQHAGECEKAEIHFAKALDAPRATEPTPDQIKTAIAAYREEMEETCPGHLDVECSPEEIAVFIDGEGPRACTEEPHPLYPGRYEVVGEYAEHEVSETVDIAAMTTHTVELDLSHVEVDEDIEAPDVVEEPVAEVEDIESPDAAGGSSTKSWVMLTGSTLSLAGGVALDTIPESSRNGQVDPINFVPVGLYAATATMVWLGIRELRR